MTLSPATNPISSNSLAPTPPSPVRQSTLNTFTNLKESVRSKSNFRGQTNTNSNFINLEELAGVKELEAALSQRDSQIRKLKDQLIEAERSFETQLSQQSRQLSQGECEELRPGVLQQDLLVVRGELLE